MAACDKIADCYFNVEIRIRNIIASSLVSQLTSLVIKQLLTAKNDARHLVGLHTPGLHNKISAYKIFARGWVAQKSFVSQWRERERERDTCHTATFHTKNCQAKNR